MQVPQTENYTEFGKGTLIGSGADFAAGAAGSLLEQAISGERVNAGRGILGGLSNAVSGAIFGNVPFKNAGQAFGKGALAGTATSGLGYLSDLAGRQPKSGQMRHFPGGAVTRTPYERLMDPRGICILQDVFGGGLGVRKAYGYRYEMRDPDQPERDGFDLGDFLRSTLTGGLMGGLTGVAFFGVGKAVGALKGSLSGGNTTVPTREQMHSSLTEWSRMEENLANSKRQLDKFNTATIAYDASTGNYYYGMNRGIQLSGDNLNNSLVSWLPEQSLNQYRLGNCAEVDAVNQALNNGADVNNLYIYTLNTKDYTS